MILPFATGDGGGFHAPTIGDIFPGPILFDGTFFEINRLQLVRFVAAAALITIFVVAARRATVVPGRFQNVIEMLLDFVRVNVAEEILGKEKAPKFVALLTTMFLAILMFNLMGIIPGLNVAATALIGLPLMLAAWTYVTYLSAGVRELGLGGFLKNNLFPPGVPPFFYLLLTPVEFLQVFIVRPATLALRLMANMVSGHLMLALCFSATQALLAAKAGATFVSPFVGRHDDNGFDGMQLISDIRLIYDNYAYETEILVASVRHGIHVLEAAKIGADVMTAPPSVIRQLVKHPLTDNGIKAFLSDWEKTGQKIG